MYRPRTPACARDEGFGRVDNLSETGYHGRMNKIVEITTGVWVNPDSVELVKAKGTGSVVQFRDTNREIAIPGRSPEQVAAMLVPLDVAVFGTMDEADLNPEAVVTNLLTEIGVVIVTMNYPCYGVPRKGALEAFRDSLNERIAEL